MKPSVIFGCTAVLLALYGCGSLPDAPERDAPLDPANPDYIAPSVTLVSGPAGDTIHTDRAVFEWTGNGYTEEYSVRLNGGYWSAWSTSVVSSLSELPEGRNVLEILAGYTAHRSVSPVPDSAVFWVDAVRGPALLTAPRTVQAAPGESFTVNLYVDEVENLAMAHACLTYDHSLLVLQSVSTGPFLEQNGGTAAAFTAVNDDTLAVTVMRAALGHAHGVTGSGTVCSLRFTVVGTGTASVALLRGPSELRDADTTIALRATGQCVVTAE